MKYALAVALLLAASCAKADSIDFTVHTDPLPDSGLVATQIGSGTIDYTAFSNSGATACPFDFSAAYHVTGMTGLINGLPVSFSVPSRDPCLGDNLAVADSYVAFDKYTSLTFSLGSQVLNVSGSFVSSEIFSTNDFFLVGMPVGLGYSFMELTPQLVATPEPATWLMLAISLALFLSFRPKRKAIQA